jgi:hypothetical protein
MVSRERVLRAIRFEPGDRLPVVGGFVRHPAFLAETAGVSIEQFWSSPRQTAITAFRKLGVDLILALILPNRASTIGSQVEHRHQTEFQSPEDVRDYVAALPAPAAVAAAFDTPAISAEYLREVADGQKECGEMLWIPNGVHRYCVVFDHCGHFGYANYVMALTLYPDVMERLFAQDAERAFLTNCAVAKATAEHGLVPVVWTGTDACDNRGPFVKPEIMEAIYFPHLKRALSPLCEAGITTIWHSDGNITPIAAALVHAGVDGFQGLQEKVDTRIDVRELDTLLTLNGRPPVFVGSISSTTTMPFGTPSDVRDEVTRWREFAVGRGGGVLLNFSSSLGPEVPESNIVAFYEEANKPIRNSELQ